MKASELQIGDWVFIEDEESPDGMSKTKVVCIHEDNTDWLHPIPITKEIMENNGFHEKYGYIHWNDCKQGYIKGAYEYAESLDEYFPFYVSTKYYDKHAEFGCDTNEDVFVKCKFVHQLQNILRFVDYDELADNFKV